MATFEAESVVSSGDIELSDGALLMPLLNAESLSEVADSMPAIGYMGEHISEHDSFVRRYSV